jgi:2-iminobutanoate/2-iminopropanoate deaminase
MTIPKFHILDGFPKSVSPSSHATEADGFVFLTGQFGRDLDAPAKPLPEGIRAQTDRTLRTCGASWTLSACRSARC